MAAHFNQASGLSVMSEKDKKVHWIHSTKIIMKSVEKLLFLLSSEIVMKMKEVARWVQKNGKWKQINLYKSVGGHRKC